MLFHQVDRLTHGFQYHIERHGLVAPSRTEGGTRRYSEDDLDRVRRILVLLDDGLNLAGVAMVLDLEDTNARLRARLDRATRRA